MTGPVAIDPISRKVHNAWLDWLRFFAALEVVLTHARSVLFVEYAELAPSSQTLPVAIWAAVTRLGYEAVMTFFVLSGFLVGGRALELARQKQFRLSNYAVDRVVRIMVPLTGAILFSALAAWFVGNPEAPLTVVGNWLSLQGAFVEVLPTNYPLWSLSYEVWFYIIGGAAGFMLTRRSANLWALLVLAAAAVIFLRLNAAYLLLWLGGAACYQYRPERLSRVQLIVGISVAAAGVVAHQLSLPKTAAPEGFIAGQALGGAMILGGFALLLPNMRAARWTSGKLAGVGTFLASFSYSLYLIHMPVLSLWRITDMTEVNVRSVCIYIGAVLSALLVSFVFSRCFETTGPRLKSWIGLGKTRASA